MEKNDKYISITQLNKYLKYKIDNDPNLGIVFLRGEISNYKRHTRGHLYFTLKDETSRINAIMFQGNANKLRFELQDGMKVLVTGRVSVYETSGTYQVYISELMEDGVGNLYIAYNQLKEKLEREGLFLESHKKKIPKIPKKIGIITAPTGAAIKDILSTIKRRWPLCETILFPSLVQGEYAKDNIVKNIKLANTYPLDLLIVGRGGGSIEDLWPFNEEIVARAIYNSKIPIISAVGHEIDFTISDFVADLRAPTPTGAAEMAVPNINDIFSYLQQINIRLISSINNIISLNNQNLNRLKDSQVLKNPYRIYEIKEQIFDNLYDRLIISINNYLNLKKEKLNVIKGSFIFKNPMVLIIDNKYLYNDLVNKLKININKIIDNKTNKYLNYINKLEVLNPVTTLKRGYSVTRINDKIITSYKNVKINDIIKIGLIDGYIESKVITVYDKKNKEEV